MKLNLHSITFRTLSLFLLSLMLFASFITITTNYTFSAGYKDLIKNKILIIENNISPSISLNLSYQFYDAIYEIGEKQLKNREILLLKIESNNLAAPIIFTNNKQTIEDYKTNNEFISTIELIDPSTDSDIGTMTLVYSKDSYEKYMRDFYEWFAYGIIFFILSIFILSYFLYRSLKPLNTLAHSLESFNPYEPSKLCFKIDSQNNEINSIANSANIMIDNILKFTKSTKKLNEEVSQKEAHLKDAQRIAKVGSWELNIIDKELSLSDEIYRILGIKLSTKIEWNDFLDFIVKKDYDRVVKVLNSAITDGSKFNIKYTLQLKNRRIHIQTRGKVRKKKDGSAKMTAVSMNITQDVKNKQIIEKLAYYDSLTDLANRLLLKDRMHKAIQQAARDKHRLGVIFLDLDHFKLINDTLGHAVGDELLVYIAKLLKEQIRESDTLSRLGGDEFVILLPNINKTEDVEKIAIKIVKALQSKHQIGSHQLYITTSIGISIYPDHADNIDDLITNADTAMYEAKNGGRNAYKLYSKTMGNYINRQLHLEQDLIQAIKDIEPIEIYYQAKIDAKNNFISGAEALVRWNHPTKGLVFPDEFIFIAESTGLMIELGNIIIEKAVFQIQEWNKQGLVGLKIAINLSSRQFQDSNLVGFISSMIEKYQVDSSQLEFEITETLSMTNVTETLRILNKLNEIGVSIAIDDFGTGHSSLSYLKQFPVNTLKIDRSFVMEMAEEESDRIIVQTIISMAHSLKFITVAEGVETQEDVALLKNMGCDQLQGYHFSKPIPKDEFTKFLQDYMPNT